MPLLPVGSAVGLFEGPRPSLVRVRAHLRGRGAADRGRHDRDGACRARRRRHDAVAGARGRGDPPRRARDRSDVPGRGARPRSGIRSPSRAPRSRSSSPSARSSESCRPSRESGHDHCRRARRSSASPWTASTGRCKVTGAAPYPSDFTFPGLAHAVLVQSTIAAGRSAESTPRRRRRRPGVLAVITHENAPALADGPMTPARPEPRRPLRDNRILHHGQHVAVVVARDAANRRRAAARLVEDRLRAEAPRYSGSTIPDAPVLRNPWGQDVDRGDVTAALAVGRGGLRRDLHHRGGDPQSDGAVRDRGALGGDRLTVHDCDPVARDGARTTLAAVFDLPESDVRVLVSVPRRRVRRRAPSLAARHPDRARGPGRRSARSSWC